MDPDPKIGVATREYGNWVEIRISDTGGGIPYEIRDKVFDLFFTSKEVGKGSGQGLSICYDVVVNKHNGQISFDSTLGVGTKFFIRLPLDDQTLKSEISMGRAGDMRLKKTRRGA